MAVDWYEPRITLLVRQAAFAGIVSGTEAVLALAIKKIQEPPKTGTVYKRRGVSHQASAPGESPATDIGTLVQSGRTEYDIENLRGYVVFSAPYAAALEYGAISVAGNWKLEARPYARPALAELQDQIREDLQRNIAVALNKAKSRGGKRK